MPPVAGEPQRYTFVVKRNALNGDMPQTEAMIDRRLNETMAEEGVCDGGPWSVLSRTTRPNPYLQSESARSRIPVVQPGSL